MENQPGLAPASKTTVNRQKGPVRVQRVLSKDPFPENLLNFILALSSNQDSHDVTEMSKRPKKRARVEDVEAIPIGRESLTIKRPAQSEVPVVEPISLFNINRGLKVHYDEPERSLTISSSIPSPYAFKALIVLSRPKFTREALVILKVLSQSRGLENEEGALWVKMAVDVERKGNTDHLQLSFQLRWNATMYPSRFPSQRKLSQLVLDAFFRSRSRGQNVTYENLSPYAFYEAAFAPAKNDTNFLSLSAPRLTSRLFPFQRRTLQWLLNREGVKWSDRSLNEEPGLEPLPSPSTTDLPLSFCEKKDLDGNSYYLSDLYHVATRDITPFQANEAALRGGILAEEMGLGKTVEMISLICMHKRDGSLDLADGAAQVPRTSGATLIVTPATLKNQWISEFGKHAPHLNVMVYDGLKGVTAEEDRLVSDLVERDVVITTYAVLQAEIHYAEEPPDRAMRHERKYHRPSSPLMQISWWRVCLDEAQQVGGGVSNAAKVARWIPRVNAWGITGTPVKEDIKDLWGLLLFLRYEPFASSTAIWEGLISSHKELFKTLFNRIALRHTKRAVRDELTLPPQKRYVITMPFTTIEEEHYQTLFEELVKTFGLNKHGAPLEADWDPKDPQVVDLMKRALSQLRQSILHPSLGPRGLLRRLDQRKPLRTADEILDGMIENEASAIRTEQRKCLDAKIRRGQLFETKSEQDKAIALWQEVIDEVKVIEEKCRRELQDELDKANQVKSDEGPEGDEKNAPTRVGECRRHLRSMLVIHHKAVFLIASGYYQKKAKLEETDPTSGELKALEEKEVSGYETAKNIRMEILQEPREGALSCIAKIKEKADSQSFVEVPEITFTSIRGLESRRVLDNFQLLGQALNEQADMIDDWRNIIIDMLREPLVDAEEEAEISGLEYEQSMKVQDDLMVYTSALRALIADRQDALSGLENERIKYDIHTAIKQANEGQGHAPETVLDLLEQRRRVKPSQGSSFRGIITDLRELATKLRYEANNGNSRAKVELDIVEKQLRFTQEQSSAQSKAATALERELDSFVTTTNARVIYYKQLQGISDTVAPLDLEEDYPDVDYALDVADWDIEEAEEVLAVKQPHHRYLLHLKEKGRDVEEICIICQSDFTLGVLTACGHQFCKECILHWLKAAKKCPMCKEVLKPNMLHDITLKKQELRFHQEPSQEHPREDSPGSDEASSIGMSRQSPIYSHFNSAKLEAIKGINLDGPAFATKIDTLVKHRLWLRMEDPGAKCVIFSQFPGFLSILGQAFEEYGIGFTSFRWKDGIQQFKENPAIECFLMDARAHASGLNLVNASHVFLCEPLLNTALELQAIARVDRIGQEHETTVWLYLIDGTVEESIYNLSVQRRLEHLKQSTKGKENEAATPDISSLSLEAANSMELEQAALSKLMSKDHALGEVIDDNDLWQCLFGHRSRARDRNEAPEDGRMNDPVLIGFLAGEAAEARRKA